MSYHDLSECTLTHAERMTEAVQIIKLLLDEWDRLSTKEQSFVEGIGTAITVKQLFWLRDIKAKYVE